METWNLPIVILSRDKRTLAATIMIVFFLMTCLSACGYKEPAKDERKKIEQFLSHTVADTMKKDYRRHNIFIDVQVTSLTIDRISSDETKQDIRYFIVGRVSYIIKGKRMWHDQEGNTIHLAPEQEIIHWFSAGILEDKYMGVLFQDEKNLLTYYAEKPNFHSRSFLR